MNNPPEEIITLPGQALAVFDDESVMGFDIETSGLSFVSDEVAVISLYGEGSRRTAILHVQGRIPPALREFLSSPRLFIGHNIAAFDLLFLAEAGIDLDGPTWFDTLLAESLTIASARKDLRVSLKAAVKRRLNVDLLKDQGLSTWMSAHLTAEQLRYCQDDVQYLPRLRQAQIKAMGAEQLRALTYEHALLPTLVKMVRRGLPFDLAHLREYEARTLDQQTWAVEHLAKALGPINLFSPTQVIRAVQEATGYQLPNGTMEAYQAMGEEAGETGTVGKALAVVKKVVTKDQTPTGEQIFNGRIYPRYRHVDRDYGRIAVSDPNLETLPPTARSLIGGQKDHSVVSLSYKNLWWGVLAALAKDKEMQKLAGEDLAAAIAGKLWTGDKQLFPEQLKEAASLARSMLFGHPLDKLQRQLRLAGLERTSLEAQSLQQQFFTAFPGLSKLHAQARAQTKLAAVPVTFPTGMRRTVAGAQAHEITSLRAKGMVGSLIKETIMQLADGELDQYLHAVAGEELILILPNSAVERGLIPEVEKCLVFASKSILGFKLPVTTKVGSHWQF